jgi:hypothetical protein
LQKEGEAKGRGKGLKIIRKKEGKEEREQDQK